MSATTVNDRDTKVTARKIRGSGRMKDGRKRSPFSMVVMFLLALLWSVPTIGLLVTSLRTRDAAATSGWWEAPWAGGWTTSNYGRVIEQADLGNAFLSGSSKEDQGEPSLLAFLPSNLFETDKVEESDSRFRIGDADHAMEIFGHGPQVGACSPFEKGRTRRNAPWYIASEFSRNWR